MWPYTNEESDFLQSDSKFDYKNYVSKRVFDGIRILSKKEADRLRKIKLRKEND